MLRGSSLCCPALRGSLRFLSSAARGHHELLGVAQGASPEELKDAYRRKALEHHPDRHTAEDRERAERDFKEVSEAYARLSDPGRRHPSDGLSRKEAETMFWELFGADGDVGLAWRVPGRSRPRQLKDWQQYQAALEDGDDRRFTSGAEAMALYRACLRALRGVDAATAGGVREHARSQIEATAGETDVKRIRTLLVDGHHALDEMSKCLSTAVVRDDVSRPSSASPSCSTEAAASSNGGGDETSGSSCSGGSGGCSDRQRVRPGGPRVRVRLPSHRLAHTRHASASLSADNATSPLRRGMR